MLTESQIEHLAKLARLDVSEKQTKQYAKQLSSVLVYFKQLNEVDTTDVPATNHITGLQNVAREDQVHEIFSEEKVLNAAPEIESRQVKVKAVFEE
jgi:aspartyl-tRNA(Asn)/glutamyl-tRNA(Gln) amidotransferase subunit C